jgi:hypothetical protein
VRAAQRDFEFATIFEQRKTNRLLVAGFSTLGQAMGELASRFEASLSELATSLAPAIEHGQAATARLVEHFGTDTQARREHEREVRAMLDNIQHRRKPAGWYGA